MLARREVVVKTLLVIDVEGRGLLLGEGRQAHPLATGAAQLYGPPDDIGQFEAGLDLLKIAIVEAHGR